MLQVESYYHQRSRGKCFCQLFSLKYQNLITLTVIYSVTPEYQNNLPSQPTAPSGAKGVTTAGKVFNSKRIIRSSKLSLKPANNGKHKVVENFLTEYLRVTQLYVDMLWQWTDKPPKFLPKSFTEIPTTLSARARQAAAKQAGGIVKGALAEGRKLNNRADWQQKQGNAKKARKLRYLANKKLAGKPKLETVEAQLDGRFFKLEKGANSFDFWLVLGSTGFAPIKIPLKNHKHFLELQATGKLLNSIRLSAKAVAFSFEVPQPAIATGKIIGIDIGQNTTLSVSSGDRLGITEYKTVCNKLSRRKKGSKGFRRAQQERRNLIGRIVNSLNLSGVGKIQMEDIKHLKRGRRTTRRLSHWSYRDLFTAIESRAEREGVPVVRVNPAYTSQRCSDCGWVQKRNRKGEQFKCAACGFTHNADLNASRNIALDLSVLPRTAVKRRANLKGFYWPVNAHEPIVREAKKAAFD